MKSCGIILRVIAVVALIGLCICAYSNYSFSKKEIEDNRVALDEALENAHKQVSDYPIGHDESKCSYCEEAKKVSDQLDDKESQLINDLVENVLTYVLYSGILFAVAGICGLNVAPKKKEEPEIEQVQELEIEQVQEPEIEQVQEPEQMVEVEPVVLPE